MAAAPLSQNRPRLTQLGILTVILAAVLYWRFGGTAEAPAVESKPRTQPAAAQPAKDGKGGNAVPSPVNFGALDQVPVAGDVERNPFKFYTPPPPPPKPSPPPSAEQLAAEAARQQLQQRPPGPPPVPPITLKFIGKFQQGGKTVVLLTDGKAQFSASEGGIIDGRYRIVKIGLESLQIEYVNGKGLMTLPFKG